MILTGEKKSITTKPVPVPVPVPVPLSPPQIPQGLFSDGT